MAIGEGGATCMSSGSLQLYLSGNGNIDLLYDNSLPEITLGGAGHPTSYTVTFEHILKTRSIDKALLELGIRVASMEIPRWKISFNDVVLTREFKPLLCVEISNGYFCKIVFDVTPIVTSKDSSQHKVDIEYIGVKELSIDHIGLLMLGSYEEAMSIYSYWSGAVSLQPGSATDIELPYEFEHAKAKIIAYLPHSDAKLLISSDSVNTIIERTTGMNELIVDLGTTKRLKLEHRGTGSYYPREILLSSILVYQMNVPEPSIDVNHRIVNDIAEIQLSNSGSDAAENVVVVSIAVGNVIDRKVLGKLEPGDAKKLQLKIKHGAINTIRVIWKHRGKTFFKDLKVRTES
ncbi:hypothetical protein [Pyrodictium delaneyi]|nr:hypothetical protein [Pyrodictium delaneyi]